MRSRIKTAPTAQESAYVAATVELFVALDIYFEIKVAGWATHASGGTLAFNTDHATGVYPGWNLDFESARLFSHATASTVLARVGQLSTLTATGRTRCRLGYPAERGGYRLMNLTSAVALATVLESVGRFGAASVTTGTGPVGCQFDLLGHAFERL